MLSVKPTENLTGVTIQGDFKDLYELVDSIYRITGTNDDMTSMYWGVQNRLFGVCYDIRHAYMGDRGMTLEENGISHEVAKLHNPILPTQNVYYNVNILFPEAIFIAASVPQMYIYSSVYYGMRKKSAKEDSHFFIPYSNYIRDKANLDVLCAGIWQALGESIGDEELESIIGMMYRANENYMYYATPYIDKCNIELIKTAVEKRKDKLRNIAKRIVKKPQGYLDMEKDLQYWAKKYKTTIYELDDPNLEYTEDFEW